MTPAERESALKELDGSQERLLGTVRGLSREQLEYRTAPERWSVAECLEHIIVVERLMFETLEDLLQQALDPSKHGDWEGWDKALAKQMVVGRKEPKQSPAVFRPTGRWPTEKLPREFEAVCGRTREFSAASGDLRSCLLVHPVLGQLDGYQWLLIVAGHCERHRLQVEEVIASTGFPRPSERKSASGVGPNVNCREAADARTPAERGSFAWPKKCSSSQFSTSYIRNAKSKEEGS